MTARYFVDSNVLIYARDTSQSEKRERAALWLNYLWDVRGYLSYQVLIESYSVLTMRRRMRADQARTYVESFVKWQPLPIDANVLDRAWQMQDRFKLNWWDSLIIAAAQLSECDFLLTEDFQAGQDLAGVVVIDPFKTTPESR